MFHSDRNVVVSLHKKFSYWLNHFLIPLALSPIVSTLVWASLTSFDVTDRVATGTSIQCIYFTYIAYADMQPFLKQLTWSEFCCCCCHCHVASLVKTNFIGAFFFFFFVIISEIYVFSLVCSLDFLLPHINL
jgi:hypothetical protein